MNTEDTLNVNPKCRVSYILGNDQPVLCTYIGFDPLFYGTDEIDEYGDDTLDDLTPELFVLDQKPQAPKGKPSYLEINEKHEKDILKLVRENAKVITSSKTKKSLIKLDDLMMRLSQSGTARIILSDIKARNVAIEINDQVAGAFYDRQASAIFVNPHMDKELAVLEVSKEMRRAWQHKNGVLIHPLTFHPDDAIVINRAQSADLIISQIRIAWELKLADDEAVWDEVMNTQARDIAKSYAREATRDFRSLNNGWASQVAFEKWFLTDRARHEDKVLIQMMLSDHQGYVFEDEDTSRMATLDLIAGLGRMPIGKNYLSSMSKAILNDPMYSEIRDRSNANFLWFIKFEKSFRETERDLQMKEGNIEATSTNAISSMDKDIAETSNVLPFVINDKDASKTSSRKRG